MTPRLRPARLLPVRVFISFDFDNDRALAAFMGEQLRKLSGFEIQNWSMKEAAPERLWLEKAVARINRSDVVLVVVGPQTFKAAGVLAEVAMASKLRPPVPVRQVIGYRALTNPTRVPGAGKLYRWHHDNLRTVLSVPRRTAA